MKGTDEIRTYSFDNDGLNELKSFEYGKNWPVVIINYICLFDYLFISS